jgi:hypothetical protein
MGVNGNSRVMPVNKREFFTDDPARPVHFALTNGNWRIHANRVNVWDERGLELTD